MTSRFSALFAPLLVVALLCATETQASDDARSFGSGYTGTLPPQKRDLARTYFDNAAVRALLEDMEDDPVGHDHVQQALSGTDITVDDLLRMKILRRDNDRYFIGFGYFTASDVRKINSVAEDMVPTLVQAYTSRQSEFDRIFGAYKVQSVTQKKLAFVLVAGFSLNWDGLKIAEEEGFRQLENVEGDDWSYSFWAAENVPEITQRAFYWGSSSFPVYYIDREEATADYTFSSFGDPYSYPRMNFPALLYTSKDDLEPDVRTKAEDIGFIHETSIGLDLPDVLGLEFGREVATILFALRTGPLSFENIQALPGSGDNTASIMALLEEVQYVERDDSSNYHLLIPVLDRDDAQMVGEALQLSRNILVQWLNENIDELMSDLGELTAIKHGVSFKVLFTQIWHDFFGMTTRDLASAGFIADGYGEDVRYSATFGTLWRDSLYDLE